MIPQRRVFVFGVLLGVGLGAPLTRSIPGGAVLFLTLAIGLFLGAVLLGAILRANPEAVVEAFRDDRSWIARMRDAVAAKSSTGGARVAS